MHSSLLPLALLGALLPAQQQSTTYRIPGTVTQIKTWEAGGETLSAISRDGGKTWLQQQPVDTKIHIRYGVFDPTNPPSIPSKLHAAPENRLFIVQFKTQIVREFRVALRRLGAELPHYLPSQSYLVRMDRGLVGKVEAMPFVRSVTEYHTAFRLDPEVAFGQSDEQAKTRYTIVFVDKRRDAAGLQARVGAIGGELHASADGGILFEATLDQKQLMRIAQDDRVLWIERSSLPEFDIDNARIQGGANYITTVAGVEGKGVHGHIVEGIDRNHTEFAARPPWRTAPEGLLNSRSTGHGTNTAGEIYARGANSIYKGIMPFAQCYYTAYSGTIFNTNNRYGLTRTLVDPRQKYKVVVQTASWGYPRTLVYTSRSAEMDDIIFDFDLFVTQSQSNAGATSQPRNSRAQAWAKNICSVGGFRHRDNSTAADDYWGRSGSIGPASDGRIGVTLSAYYDSIRTTSTSNRYTTRFGGTSGATPIINGFGGNVVEMFARGMFGYPAAKNYTEIFAKRPHFSTTKALMVATAKQLAYDASGRVRGANRYQQGFGFPDMRTLYDERNRLLVINELDVLRQGQSRTYFVFVPPGTPEFHAHMTYPDREAAANARIHRINSVDLQVRFNGGDTYWGNNGLLTGATSTKGGTANDRDTEESVIVRKPPSGLAAITVRATGVRKDGHVETKVADVDYALVVRGLAGLRDKTGMELNVTSARAGNLAVSLKKLPTNWTTGFTLFSLATTRPLATGNIYGLELDGLALSLIREPVAVGNVFHFSRTNARVYPNTSFTFPVAIALAVQGLTLDAVAIALDRNATTLGVSNVSRVTVK